MSVENLYQKVLTSIKDKELKPKARWYFLLKNYLIWTGGVLALLISAAAFSVMIYLFKYNDFALRQQINKNYLEILLVTLPYFWILFLIFFIFIIYYNIKHTKKGYRYPLWLMALVSFLASIFLGVGFSFAKLGEKIDQKFLKSIPLYAELINPQIEFWSHPEEGRLVGLSYSKVIDNQFQLVDKNNQGWIVTLEEDVNNEELLEINQPIRVFGKQVSETEFLAEAILPLMPGRGFFERYHQASGTPLMPHDIFLEDHKPMRNGMHRRNMVVPISVPIQDQVESENSLIIE